MQSRKFWINFLMRILSILLPPLGVFLQVGLSGQFFLNILLTLLGYIPGIIHAIWIIARRQNKDRIQKNRNRGFFSVWA